MEPFLIDTREQYDLCKAHGIEPLIDRRFTMEIRLRVSIQRELFGTGHTPAENERFYPGNGPRPAKRQYPFVRNAQPLGKWRPAQYADIPGKPVDC